jgi:hypothetical protein
MTQCDICGQEGITLRYISRSYGKGDNLLVIENMALPPTVWKVYNSNTTVGGGVCG